jgi:hypothetical protein
MVWRLRIAVCMRSQAWNTYKLAVLPPPSRLPPRNGHGKPRFTVAGLFLSLRLCQSALFDFQSLLLVIILMICTCTYIRAVAPGIVDRNKQGWVRVHLASPSALLIVSLAVSWACSGCRLE